MFKTSHKRRALSRKSKGSELETRFFKIKQAIALAAALLTFVSPTAFASNTQAGTVHDIIVSSTGKAFFSHTGSRTGQPSCAIALDRWVFDVTTPKGQAMLAFIMTAYSTGKQIRVYGTGACTDWGDTETVDYVETAD